MPRATLRWRSKKADGNPKNITGVNSAIFIVLEIMVQVIIARSLARAFNSTASGVSYFFAS